MSVCVYCGAPLKPNAMFCPNCGKPVAAAAVPPVPPVPPTVPPVPPTVPPTAPPTVPPPVPPVPPSVAPVQPAATPRPMAPRPAAPQPAARPQAPRPVAPAPRPVARPAAPQPAENKPEPAPVPKPAPAPKPVAPRPVAPRPFPTAEPKTVAPTQPVQPVAPVPQPAAPVQPVAPAPQPPVTPPAPQPKAPVAPALVIPETPKITVAPETPKTPAVPETPAQTSKNKGLIFGAIAAAIILSIIGFFAFSGNSEDDNHPAARPAVKIDPIAAEDRPTLNDFAWFLQEVEEKGVPEHVARLTAPDVYSDLKGTWKGLVHYDYINQGADEVLQMLNFSLDGNADKIEITAIWRGAFIVDTEEIRPEQDEPASLFKGKWEGKGFWASGDGTIHINEIFVHNGMQFAVGTFDSPDGTPSSIAMMRNIK